MTIGLNPIPGSATSDEPKHWHEGAVSVSVRGLKAWFGDNEVLHGVDAELPARRVTAVIGPSGCGKSTFLRCINRLHETVPIARCSGEVLLDGVDIYDKHVDPVLLRRKVGMVFQKPNPFPNMSIRDNVLAGLRLTRQKLTRAEGEAVVQKALEAAAMWDEVKDRLKAPGTGLSGGQQQRLCIARTLAVEPDVILMDEPCSALDPIATARVETLIAKLKQRYTIIIVTHNMQQARRVSDGTAFFLGGHIVETNPTEKVFEDPDDARTRDYVSGKFG